MSFLNITLRNTKDNFGIVELQAYKSRRNILRSRHLNKASAAHCDR